MAALRDRPKEPGREKRRLLKLVDLLVEVVVNEIAREVQEPGQSSEPKKYRGGAKS